MSSLFFIIYGIYDIKKEWMCDNEIEWNFQRQFQKNGT